MVIIPGGPAGNRALDCSAAPFQAAGGEAAGKIIPGPTAIPNGIVAGGTGLGSAPAASVAP
jgi:hypothetical protein